MFVLSLSFVLLLSLIILIMMVLIKKQKNLAFKVLSLLD